MSAEAFSGRRVTVMGLGTRGGGLGVARFLAENGATVTVTDMRSAQELAEPMAGLAGLPIRFVLGRHDEHDFSADGADMIVRNPGVRRSSPLLQRARAQGVRVEMEMSLFLRTCPAPTIGITGTKGKTSTAMLCGAMLQAWDPTTVVAGNMGVTALGQLRSITPSTPVVLELSSWQVEATAEHRLGPRIAVLTNISEDHLDAYDGFADYAATKRSICVGQPADGWLVVNADDPEAWRAADETPARIVPFGLGDRGTDGAWVVDRLLIWRRNGREDRIAIPDRDPLAGEHQARNIAAAAAAALLRGATSDAVRAGLNQFEGVRDRMERVAEIDGVAYINDTAATAPAAAIAALRRFSGGRVLLIAGGADKRTDMAGFATTAAALAARIFLLQGTATDELKRLLLGAGARIDGTFAGMDAAVTAAHGQAVGGDVILLSPGCASFGMFRDEFDRGEQFRQAVRRLPSRNVEPR